jgi:hypothetical protein
MIPDSDISELTLSVAPRLLDQFIWRGIVAGEWTPDGAR